MTGKVYLVGAGPGAPDLLTLRAADLLRRADIVFHDALVHSDTLALAQRAQKVAVGKRCGRHSTAQRFINKRLIDAARRHAVVIRLKGGDPMMFGRAQEEIDALVQAGILFAVVPGVTAALATSAELGISLTQRGIARSVVLTTPRVGIDEAASDWAVGIDAGTTIAIYMGAGKAGEVVEKLLSRGIARATPAVIVENATLPERRDTWCTVGTLARTARQSVEGPALIIIGRVLDKARQCAQTAETSDDRTDDFLDYGNSWFR
jgi:uroporphyrin-III C-methyltransferase